MKYDIYFHNDFDGRASAAVMLAFLRGRGDDIQHYVALTYGREAPWLATDLAKKKNPAIVVDFIYHPGAAWWFDHHATTFRKPGWKKKFRPDRFHSYDPSYKSACRLAYTMLKKNFKWKPPRHFAELVKWLDIMDSAGYRSARETIAMKQPAYQVNAFIDVVHQTAKDDAYLIGLLAEQSLSRVVKAPRIAAGIRVLRKKVARSMRFYEKNLRVFKRTTLIDTTGDPLNGLLRYAPYYFYPRIVYHIRLKGKGDGVWYLGVGANPWRRSENAFHLGKYMREHYGGGGHKDIGATEFRTKAEALAAAEKINAILNR